ncbi:MAG TPA: HNH endonuclease domain-containing protein [Lutibacter sp.]
MSKIKLGLDLGTNSIGWSVLEKDNGKYNFLEFKGENDNLIPTKGSYIFQKGADAKENSKAAERRGFRGARRRLERIILRKIATLKVLNEFGLCPPFDEGELNKWKNKKIYPCENEKFIEWQRTGKKKGNSENEKLKQPYYLRHLAATKDGLMESKEGKMQLGRALYHLSQRRGYLSNGDEEQTEDKLDLFKTEVSKLLEETNDAGAFIEPFQVLFENRKADKKVITLGNKIQKELKKEIEFEKVRSFIITEFDKPENLGTVMKSIGELSEAINKSGQPTMGSYFYTIYAKADKKTGLITKIRGRYTHREIHYKQEFLYICQKQNIKGELKDKLYNAIFYQRPLKSQKGLVAMCPLEPKRKRIAISHPLFEEFRMWESINRIKRKDEGQKQLDFLTTEEKELIKPLFLQKTEFEFNKIANKLSGEKMYCYIKKPNEVFYKGNLIEGGVADLYFNFPLDKKFSACPTLSVLIRFLGKEKYNELPLLNTGFKDEKGKTQISIEDIWHCLFLDTFGNKDKKQGRKEFAEKHLELNLKGVEDFQKIKLDKGYGSLSKAALKKIVPFLKKGEIYSHAVFLANITKVLSRNLNDDEQETIAKKISEALNIHKIEKQNDGIINNYISRLKEKNENLGNNSFSIEAHQKSLKEEILSWVGETQFNIMTEKEIAEIFDNCWYKFSASSLDKNSKDIPYLSTKTIPEFIFEKLSEVFPTDKIDVTKLYHPSAMEAYPIAHKKLGNPEISSIKNPVFNRSMHQIKRLCNELIRQGIVDKDTEVNVEVAGEINSASYRRALSQWQKEQEIIRAWAKNEIIDTYPKDCRHEINPTDTDVIKFVLWKEQNYQCIYTGNQISICEFLGGKTTYDIEHTIPRSKFHDNSLSNKTLADAEFNRKVKKNILPGLLNENYKGKSITKESIILNRNANLKSYSLKNNVPTWNVSLKMLEEDFKKYTIAAKATSDPIAHGEFREKVHYTKIKLDYLSSKFKNFENKEITNQFTNANLVDTRIIAKYARAYLNSYFNKVNVVNGKITDTLRKMWGLEGEYAVKDRSNHIHHCIDAITLACVEKGTANWISEAFHLYESDYFKGNDNPKYKLKEPMDNFAERMHNLHQEVFIFHKQTDRIKPLLEALKKENPKKQNLRGKLNSQNPYAHIKKNDEFIFAQRKPITSIGGGDIENIIDEGIKVRLLKLADDKGWVKLMDFHVKDDENSEEKELEHRRTIAYRVFEKIRKYDKKKEIVVQSVTKQNISSDFTDLKGFVASLFNTIIKIDVDEKKRVSYKEKIENEVTNLTRTKGLELLLSENKESEGAIILPEYYDEKNKKQVGRMVIKKLRLKSSKTNLKDYKEIRKIDESKFEHKRDYYFDKDSYTNYEAQIFGDLIPNENGKLKNRKYKLINHYNIVKNIFEQETEKPILKLHQDDMFLVFDKMPNDEIKWESKKDLQNRLFKIVKFDENGILVLVRHNYASGNVDNAKAIKSEGDLSNLSEVVLRRSPSTIRIIPVKIDTLGNIDIEFSKKFIELNL